MSLTDGQIRERPPRVEWERWIRSPIDERAVGDGCWFDFEAADRVRQFCLMCRQSKGQWAGQPVELLTWQWEELVAPLFGWMRPDGTRRYRQFYVEVPKKNGKSTLMAALELYLLVGDGEPAAEVYTAAADRSQATIIHAEAEAMVHTSPALSRRLVCTTSVKRIVHPASRSFIKALSADAKTKEGLNAHAVIFDELHAQPTPVLWDTLRYAGASRRQPILGAITTAGDDKHGLCYEQRKIAKRVLDGDYPGWDFLACIYEAGDDADWTDPVVWRRANPSLGVTIQETDFAAECREAQESPRKEATFRRYRLNQWLEGSTRWLNMEAWDACVGDDERTPMEWRTAELERLKGRPCVAALDLASKLDLAGFMLLFADGEDYVALPWFFCPADTIRDRERRDRVPYSLWAREGWLTPTAGNVIDYRAIRNALDGLREDYRIEELAYDPWNATQLTIEMQDDGYSTVEFGQSLRNMNEPSKELESLVLAGRIKHGGNPMLRWMAGNVCVRSDPSGNYRPDKETSAEKIDGIVMLVMGLGRQMTRRTVPPSVYETRGILTLCETSP